MKINNSGFTGNLTREPELKYTASGNPILNLGVAIDNSYKDQSGKWIEKPCFIDVTLFGKYAEIVAPKLKKGLEVYIEGSLNMDSWVDKSTGQNRYKHTITARTVQLTQRAPKTEGDQSYSNQAPPQRQAPNPAPQEPPPMPSFDDEDIPF